MVTDNDFWAELASKQSQINYHDVRENFQWNLPEFYNIGVDISDRHAVDRTRLALIYDREDGHHEKWTYYEISQESNRLANVFLNMHISQRDRIAIFLSQSPQLPIAHIAAYKIGAIAVPLFTLFGSDALAYRINDSGARVLITDSSNLYNVIGIINKLSSLEHIIITDFENVSPQDTTSIIHSWRDLVSNCSTSFTPVATTPDDPAIIIYTSGTTGQAKGALHGHRVLLGHLPGVAVPHDLAPQEGDLFWTPADWAWIGGLFDVLFPAMHWGLPILAHRMSKFTPEKAFDLMEKWKVRNVFLPPTSLKMMRRIKDPQNHWDLNLRSIASGGEPLGEETLRWATESFGIHINEFYGQTECNLVIGNGSSLYPVQPNSMGRALPGHEVGIIDEEGNLKNVGEPGEIAVKAPDPVMFITYWNKPEATSNKYIGNWLKTGDMGYVDENGYFYFIGRSDDIINSSGYRIGPAEVEEVLVQHPAILMAAVVGSPDPLRGEIVKAFIKLRNEQDASNELIAEIQSWVKERLAAYEYPREVEFVEQFPQTLSGKIMRGVLRQQEYERKK